MAISYSVDQRPVFPGSLPERDFETPPTDYDNDENG